jgi:hypothetical protein
MDARSRAPRAWAAEESLAQSLRAVLGAHGIRSAYDEVVSVLGLGSKFCLSGSDCVAEWELLAQDSHLPRAAALYGVELRELHPPEAAAGLGDSAEFRQHFEDSYVPLIRRALQNQQCCIARRGWERPLTPAWGVLTGANGDLRGLTVGAAGPELFPGPAMQVYVVERVQADVARRVPRDSLLECALAAAKAPAGRTDLQGWRTAESALAERAATQRASPVCRFCGEPDLDCCATLRWQLREAARVRSGWFARMTGWANDRIDEVL